MKMEQIECSETSAYINQTPGNYPKENTLYSEHGESLKSRILHLYGEETVRHLRLFENFASREPNSSPLSLSSSAAETTIPYPASYNFIITSTPELPTESIIAPALPYSEKEYSRTDENWTKHH